MMENNYIPKDISNSTNPIITSGSWQCATCGVWVAHGRQHTCYSQSYLPQWYPTYQPIFVDPNPILEEIRDLLKQLIKVLEDKG